jgi:hypothetical protein
MVKSASGLHLEIVRSPVDSEHRSEFGSVLNPSMVENHVPMFNYLKSNRARLRNVPFMEASRNGLHMEDVHRADLVRRNDTEAASNPSMEGIAALANSSNLETVRLRNVQSMDG